MVRQKSRNSFQSHDPRQPDKRLRRPLFCLRSHFPDGSKDCPWGCSGRFGPASRGSYARIAEAAGCAERTVGRCLPDLEAAGLLTWRHRIRRAREYVAGLAGIGATDWRVMRTSNAYDFPACAKRKPAFADTGHLDRGTRNPDLFSPVKEPTPLEAALARLGQAVRGGL
jgi:hypothetical protein